MANRRNFLKTTGVGVVVAALPGIASATVQPLGGSMKASDVKLGIASYTLRNFTLEQVLDMIQRCDIHRTTFKSMHLPLDSDKETIKKTAQLCRNKGIALYAGGVIYMKSKDEVDQGFEYAKTAGMDMIIGVPNHELLDYVEGKVKEYDIKLAIHNHGPGDKLYPSAESAYDLIKIRDKRMGLCIDIGHTKRIGRDPEQDLKDFFPRVFDMHVKDVTKAASDGETCIIGRGIINFPSFMKAVVDMGYQGTLDLEYEAEGNDPLPGMMESLGYMKGILATM